MDSALFSQLRHYLQQPASLDLWEKLISFLEDWPDSPEKDMALAYTQSHLETWRSGQRPLLLRKDKTKPSPTHFALAKVLHVEDSAQNVLNHLEEHPTGDYSGLSLYAEWTLLELQLLLQQDCLHSLHALALWNPDYSQKLLWNYLEKNWTQQPLKALLLHGRSSSLEHLHSLFQSPTLASLQHFSFQVWSHRSDAMHSSHNLAAAFLEELLSLQLGYVKIDFSSLFAGNRASKLQHLSLTHCALTKRDTRSLADSRAWEGLESIQLYRTLVDEETEFAFFSNPCPPKLRHLKWQEDFFSARIMTAMKEQQWLSTLRSLKRTDFCINTALFDLKDLRGTQWTELRELQLNYQRFSLSSMHSWLLEGDFPVLRTLSLNHSQFPEESLSLLFQCEWMNSVERLELKACGVGEKEVRAMLDSPYLHQLKILDISENQIHDDLWRDLENSPLYSQLQVIYVNRNKLSRRMRKYLREKEEVVLEQQHEHSFEMMGHIFH